MKRPASSAFAAKKPASFQNQTRKRPATCAEAPSQECRIFGNTRTKLSDFWAALAHLQLRKGQVQGLWSMLPLEASAQSSAQVSIAPHLHPAVFGFLSKRDVAKRQMGLTCRAWLKSHSECAWVDFVLCMGRPPHRLNPSDLERLNLTEQKGHVATSTGHATMSMLMTAHERIRSQIAQCVRKLTLLVVDPGEPQDVRRFLKLPFCELRSFEICSSYVGNEHAPPLDAFFKGLLRSDCQLLTKLQSFVWNGNISQWCSAPLLLKAINSMPYLRVLDILELPFSIHIHGSRGVRLKLPPTLEYCQAIGFNDNLQITPLPKLQCLALGYLQDAQSLQLIFTILKESCPHLPVLKVWLISMPLTRASFQDLPHNLKKLVLLLDSVKIDGLQGAVHIRSKTKELAVRDHMQAWMPPGCHLVVRTDLIQQSVTSLEDEDTSDGEDANEGEEETSGEEASPEPLATDSEDD